MASPELGSIKPSSKAANSYLLYLALKIENAALSSAALKEGVH
jgi:hypothetical protein